MINHAMRNTNIHSSARVLGDTFVVSEKFISNCLTFFDEAMQQKAQKVERLIIKLKLIVQVDSIFDRDFFFLQDVKNNPVFLISEEDLKHAPMLNESAAPSKKEKKEAERKTKATGVFSP